MRNLSKSKFNLRILAGSMLMGALLFSISLHGTTTPSTIPPQERAALIALYNSTNGDSWTDNSNWKTPPLHTDGFAMPGTENTWYGITCDPTNTKVTQINIGDNNLNGTLPTELGNLTNLELIQITDNSGLTGSIPTELGNLINLKILNIPRCQLTGGIPSELGKLVNLTNLNLYNNQLTGTIPTELGKMVNLSWLYLASNQLSGAIPSQLGDLVKLTYFDLTGNQLTGSIPTELGKLVNVKTFFIGWNQLTGTIPTELGDLASATYITLASNQLTGSLPTTFGSLTNLKHLYVQYNQLSGNIPTQLGILLNLENLALNGNQFSGTIPTVMGKLTKLKTLYLSANMLIGSVPTQLANLTNLKDDGSTMGYNALYTNDDTLRTFLNTKFGKWESTQTIAPDNLKSPSVTDTTVDLNWDLISFTSNTGGYRVYYRTGTKSYVYTYFGTTASKSTNNITVTGLNPSTTYYFRIKTRTDSHGSNQNTVDSEYSAEVSATTNSSLGITVDTPNGGEVLPFGSTYNITWTAAGVGPLKISIWKKGHHQVIATNVDPSLGSYSWKVGHYIGGTAPTGGNYKIKIKEVGTMVSDASDAPFTITPNIIVTAPNGGESLVLGSTVNINWTAAGVGSVKISLWKDGVHQGGIANNLDPSLGSHSWTVGQYLNGPATPGTGYTIKIRALNSNIFDYSDVSFTITN